MNLESLGRSYSSALCWGISFLCRTIIGGIKYNTLQSGVLGFWGFGVFLMNLESLGRSYSSAL